MERLAERGDLESTAVRFVAHMVGFALELAAASRSGWDARVLTRLRERYDDLMAALRWSLEPDAASGAADPTAPYVLAAVLWGVVHQGHAEEVSVLAERVVAHGPAAGPAWADAVATAATCRFLLGRPAAAIELAERTLGEAEGSLLAPCTLRQVIAQSHAALGDLTGAVRWFDEAISEADRCRMPPLALEMRVLRAALVAETGDVDGALDALRTARAQAEAAGPGSSTDLVGAWARTTEGYALLARGATTALPVVEDALSSARRLGDVAGVIANLHALAIARLSEGDPDGDRAAAEALLELLGEVVAHGAHEELGPALRTMAVALWRRGRASWAELAATARSLPVVSVFAGAGPRLLPLPEAPDGAAASTVVPLSVRDAILLARRELGALRAGDAPRPAEGRGSGRGGGDLPA